MRCRDTAMCFPYLRLGRPLQPSRLEITISQSPHLIYPNTYTMHMDMSYWGDPEVFRPERFVVDGRFTPNDRNIPFGVGRRRCLGETLARMENFLIFANLMKSFSFRSGDGSLPSLRPLAGLTNGPQPFSMKIMRK